MAPGHLRNPAGERRACQASGDDFGLAAVREEDLGRNLPTGHTPIGVTDHDRHGASRDLPSKVAVAQLDCLPPDRSRGDGWEVIQIGVVDC